MKNFQHGVVQLVLKNSHQIAFNGLSSFRDAVDFELDAIFFTQQMLLRLILLATIQRQTAKTHLVSADTLPLAERTATPLRIDAILIQSTWNKLRALKTCNAIQSLQWKHLIPLSLTFQVEERLEQL